VTGLAAALRAVLPLPTGRVIIADPSALFGDAKPLDLTLPPGQYPVLSGAHGLELRLTEAEPERWEAIALGFAAPSEHVCLLDKCALEDFTDLGDEPVDEYELLTEKLRAQPGGVVLFRGLVVFPGVSRVRTVRAGYDRAGRCSRIVAEV
jgi:hypothetical protein